MVCLLSQQAAICLLVDGSISFQQWSRNSDLHINVVVMNWRNLPFILLLSCLFASCIAVDDHEHISKHLKVDGNEDEDEGEASSQVKIRYEIQSEPPEDLDDELDDAEAEQEDLLNSIVRIRALLLRQNVKSLDEMFKADTLRKLMRLFDIHPDEGTSPARLSNSRFPDSNGESSTNAEEEEENVSAFDRWINRAQNAINVAISAVKEHKELQESSQSGSVDFDDGVDIDSDILVFRDYKPDLENASEEEKKGYDLFNEAHVLLKNRKPPMQDVFKILEDAANLGNINAKLQIGWSKLFGAHMKQNVTEARKIFEEVAAQNVPFAQMTLGFLYASGIGIQADQAKALVHYTFAALGGNTWARMALGYRYWSGATVHSSCERALDFYRLVSNKVASDVSLSGGPTIQRVRLIEEAENVGYNTGMIENDLVEYYQLLAEKGDVKAQVVLGQLHYQGGRGVPLDLQKAVHFFSMAAESGNAIALAFLGKIYMEGNGDNIKQDNLTAFMYFKQAAEMNNPVGQAGLGLMYLQGQGVEKDYSKALHFFTQAAEQGWVDGQLQLGVMYFNGLGTPRDYELANKYFTQASQSGHVLAFYNLAQMHATGTGMLRSCSTASELFKNVAERGRWAKKLMISHTKYREGHINEAFVGYAFLSELGYEVAQSNAAFLLDRREVSLWQEERETYARALMYWSRAAAQGYSTAQVKLGDYYYYGLGTGVDYETAALHYKLASDSQHNAQAMFNLGYMHEQGLGMNKDLHLAKRCYDMAAETSPDAKIPATLALMKLSLFFSWKYLQEINWLSWLTLGVFQINWYEWLSLGLNDSFSDSSLFFMMAATAMLMYYLRRFPPDQR
nr:PREDICTED: protein sel-1 homolog 1-like [Bemisia tabaci]